MEGIRNVARETGHKMLVQGPGPMFHTGFTSSESVLDFRGTLDYDKKKLSLFIAGMHDRGIRIIGRGLWYISTAHSEEDIRQAIETTRQVLLQMDASA